MDETKRRPGNNRSDSGTKKLSEDSLKRNNKKRSNKVNSEAEKCREKAEGVKPPRMIKRSARKDINENKAQNRRQPSKYKREAIKTEDPLKNRGFEQGWKSTIVRSSRVSRERIDQLSKPSKSVLLTTWQTYSDVFDYDRMRKIMDKLHYEFSLTPQEKKMCMEQMKKNAIELSNKIALGSTEEIRRLHIGTEDLQRLSLLSNQAKNVRRSRRTEELARPRSYKVLATWNEYNHILPSDKRMKFQRKYVDNLLNQITHVRQPRLKSSHCTKPFAMIQKHEKLMAREAAYKLVEKGIQQAVAYALEGRPLPPMTQALIELSDNILSVLSNFYDVKTPFNSSSRENAKFLLYIADWTAKIISDAYVATENIDATKKVFEAPALIPTPPPSNRHVKDTIPEQDEQHEDIEERETEVFKVADVQTQTEPKKMSFEEIPEIDNSFGNDNDWNPEERKLQDETKNEIKKLTIKDSKTEIIHIREDEKEKKSIMKNVTVASNTGIGDHIDVCEDKKEPEASESYESFEEEAFTDISTD